MHHTVTALHAFDERAEVGHVTIMRLEVKSFQSVCLAGLPKKTAHRIAVVDELLDKSGADEAVTACDKDFFHGKKFFVSRRERSPAHAGFRKERKVTFKI
jgi:hypothetical protein